MESLEALDGRLDVLMNDIFKNRLLDKKALNN